MMGSRKRFASFVAASLLLALLQGCWDHRELNNIAIINMAAIDRDENGFCLTVGIIRPITVPIGSGGIGGGGGSPERGILRLAGKGTTIFEAETDLARRSPRWLYWGQFRTLIVSTRVAEESFSEVADFFARHPEIRLNTWILATKEEAADIASAVPEMEKSAGTELEGILSTQRHQSGFYTSTLREIFLRFNSPKWEPTLTMVKLGTILPANPRPEGMDKDLAVKTVELAGLAVLRNGKYVGHLDREETRGVFWVYGQANRADIVIKGEEGKPISLRVVSSKGNIKPANGNWRRMEIKIKVEAEIIENLGNRKINTPLAFEQINKKAEQLIQKEVEKAIEASKKYESDFFGFGMNVYQYFPQQWKKVDKDWPEHLKELEIDLDITVITTHPGLIIQFIEP